MDLEEKLKAINNINRYIKVNNEMYSGSENYVAMTWKGKFPNSFTRNLDIQVEIPTKEDFENALQKKGEERGVDYPEGTKMEDFLYCSYYNSMGKKVHSVLVGKDEDWPFKYSPEEINKEFEKTPVSADGIGGGRKKTKRRKSKRRKSKRKKRKSKRKSKN